MVMMRSWTLNTDAQSLEQKEGENRMDGLTAAYSHSAGSKLYK